MIYFQPNCTIPPEPPALVSGPNVRSTMEIAWSCISTLLLCCWSIQHLNVPVQTQPKTTGQRFMRKLYFLRRKVGWTLVTLIAPEVLLAKALTDLRSCRRHSRLLRDLAEEDGVPWSNTHTFLADMGGFALRFTPVSNLPQSLRLSELSAVHADAQSNPSSQWGSISATSESRRNVDDIELVQGQARHQKLGRSLVEHRQRQERLASVEALRRAPTACDYQSSDAQATSDHETVTQSYSDVGPSRDRDPSSLSTGIEQIKRQAETSAEPTQKNPHMESLDEGRIKTREDRQIWEERRSFYRRVTSVSRRYGDLVWTVHEPHVINVTAAFWTLFSEDIVGFYHVVSALLLFEGDVWVLTAAQLIEARKRKLIDRLPNLTEDEVSDRDKGNFLVKFLAILQVLWLVVQLISRTMLNKLSTPLEIMTLSFAACAFVTYILLLGHPQDVNTPIYLNASRPSTAEDVLAIARLTPTVLLSTNLNILPRVPNNAYHHIWPLEHGRGASRAWLLIGAGAGASIFGGIHLVAWNFIFPDAVERSLWRISSLLTLLVPLANIVLFFLSRCGVRGRSFAHRAESCYWLFVIVLWLFFGLARLFLMVEAFRSLYYLPPDAYSATWAANVPHVA